jgi:cellulose synthase/poly-beta-1,6-N-acetylglucosamine synthase-like glycosyltransferase
MSGNIEGEVPLSWNIWIRQIHRWLSIAFTFAVIANLIVMVQGVQVLWVGLLALFPLILLLLSGLYLFVLPYAAKRRHG